MENNEINQFFDIMLHCMRYYNDPEFRNHFGLFEYYSMTDMSPKELAKVARKFGNVSLAANLIEFDVKQFWHSIETNETKIMACDQIVNSKCFLKKDKLTIIETLDKEGYPLIDGVYYGASRRYGYYGVKGILKETTRNKLIEFYCQSKGINVDKDCCKIEKEKVLIK